MIKTMQKMIKRKNVDQELSLTAQVHLYESSAMPSVLIPDKKVIFREEFAAMNQAKQIMITAKKEAKIVIDQAKSLLSRTQEEFEKNKQKGFEQGKKEGLNQMTQMFTKAAQKQDEMLEKLEKDMVQMVYDISEKILGRELHERDSAIVDLVREALHSAMGQHITILVNPQDLDILKKSHTQLMQTLDVSKSIQIRSDEKVALKGCLIETEVGTVDAQLETQLSAIRTALGLQDKQGRPIDNQKKTVDGFKEDDSADSLDEDFNFDLED